MTIFAYSWVREKTGVNASRPGQVHGHKILVHKMTTSLQSLSRLGVQKIFCLHKNRVPRVFQRLLKNVLCRARRPFLSFPTAVQGVPLVPPPPPEHTSCTCRPRQADGDDRANGRNRKIFRTRTVQMHHQGRPGPSGMSFQAGTTIVRHFSLSNSRPNGSVQLHF